MLLILVNELFEFLSNRSRLPISTKFLEEDSRDRNLSYKDVDFDIAMSIHAYAKYAYLVGVLGRLILLVLTVTRFRIFCKSYLYYELTMLLVSECLVCQAF